jgi:hypothetical protein
VVSAAGPEGVADDRPAGALMPRRLPAPHGIDNPPPAVVGAYNVRYEIIKKRIDKAVIHDTTERLTQPGKIALVYSHVSEALEWRDYIEYLQTLEYLMPDVEELELEELAGARAAPCA